MSCTSSSKSNSQGKGGGNSQKTGLNFLSTDNLPQLEGSEKQNAWAEDIRKNLINGINEKVESGDIDFVALKDLYYGLLPGSNDRQKNTPYSEQIEKIRSSNPDIATRDLRKEAENYVRKLNIEAGQKANDAEDRAISQGVSADKAKSIRNKAYAKEVGAIYLEWSRDLINARHNSSAWISDFKNSKYNTYYKK